MASKVEHIGNHELLEVIREDELGKVYQARRSDGDPIVDLRVLPEGLFKNKGVRKRFIDGMKKVQADLKSCYPRWLSCQEEEGGRVVLVQELCDRRTLRDELVESGALELKRVLKIGAEIADALSSAHSGITVIHGDLRPENVHLLVGDGIKLRDFQLAHLVDQLATASTRSVARLRYLSPEQLSEDDADERSDLHSLGLILREMLTGEAAFKSQSVREIIDAKLESAPARLPSDLLKRIPERLETLINAMLAIDPEARPERAADVRDELQELLAKAGASASPDNDLLNNYIGRVMELTSQRNETITKEELHDIALDVGMSEADLAAADKAAESHFVRGKNYLRHKLWDDAIEQLNNALVLAPVRTDVVFSLASAYRGRWDARRKKADGLEAQRLAKRCIELEPHHNESFEMLAELEGALQELAETAREQETVKKEAGKAVPVRAARRKKSDDVSWGNYATLALLAMLVSALILFAFDPLGGRQVSQATAPQQSTQPDQPQPITEPTPVPIPFTSGASKDVGEFHVGNGTKLRRIDQGTFKLGSANGVGESDEHPQRVVNLDTFYLDETEVSVEEYKRCVDAGSCPAGLFTAYSASRNECNYGAPGRDKHPMNCVSAEAAENYCAWRSAHDSIMTYRLPTEAEWEKAAKGTNDLRFPWGEYAADCTTAQIGGCGSMTAPVASFSKDVSPYGVVDLGGNVSEWTVASYATAMAEALLVPGAKHAFSIRGGNWKDRTSKRSADRDTTPMPLGASGLEATDIGFRCAGNVK